MPNIYTQKGLPSKIAIQNVASFSDQFESKDFDLQQLLISLRESVYQNNFMTEQDNWQWASTRGVDYFENPKLFSQAPLIHVCAFVSEIFKRFEIEEIKQRLPVLVLQKALQRLKSFS